MKVFSFGKIVATMFVVLAVIVATAPRYGEYFSPVPPAYAQTTCALTGPAPAKLTWQDNSTNEAEFEIERGVNGGAFVLLATVKANVQTYTDTTVLEGNTYTYRVRASNAGGKSNYSNVGCKTIPVAPPNGAPTNLVLE